MGGIGFFCGELWVGCGCSPVKQPLGMGVLPLGLGELTWTLKLFFTCLNSPGFMGFGRVNGKAVCKGGEGINEV